MIGRRILIIPINALFFSDKLYFLIHPHFPAVCYCIYPLYKPFFIKIQKPRATRISFELFPINKWGLLQVPLRKGGFRGLCFSPAIPHFHEDKFTTPSPPLLRGILMETHVIRVTLRFVLFFKEGFPMLCLNKMKIPIRFN